ncbi:MAG: PilZ domain-containing protein [Sphingomonadales bacterium]|nr:PilZ domain-containing protein [Sphingomonadales bacterium]
MAIFGFRRRKFHERAAERYACRIPARVVMCDSGVIYDGVISNLSLGGAMFRPALSYLLSRKSGEIVIEVDGSSVAGEIVGTSPHGYGIRFAEPIAAAQLSRLLDLSAHAAAA